MKFNENEEGRSPKASPLTLVGFLKALVESEEGERREDRSPLERGKR